MPKSRYLRRLLGVCLFACLSISMVAGSGSPFAQAAAPTAKAPTAKSAGSSAPTAHSESVVYRVYFTSTAQRDSLASEFGAEEVATTSGYLTLWTDKPTYNVVVSRGL